MKSTKLTWLAIVIATLGGAALASADTLILNPTQQSMVNGDDLNTNFSTEAYDIAGRSVGEPADPGDRIWATYLQFQLPVNAGTITSGTLTLDLFSVNGTALPMGINPRYVISDAWTAATLTYANAPGYTSTEAFGNGISTPTTLVLDVTSFLQQSGEGFGNALSIAVLGTSNFGGQADISEWVRIGKAGGDGVAPILTVEYTPVPEPGTVALLAAAGGVALLLRRRKLA